MNTAKIKCNECGKEFERRIGEINRSKRLGRPNFCGSSCSSKHYVDRTIKRSWGKNNHNLKSNNRKDEFSPFRIYLNHIKQRFKKGGHKYSITLQDLKDQWEKQKGICPYSGIKLEIGESSTININLTPNKASIDRIDSSKGYEVGNIEFISCIAQFCKHTWTKEEVIEFCNRVSIYHRRI